MTDVVNCGLSLERQFFYILSIAFGLSTSWFMFEIGSVDYTSTVLSVIFSLALF